MKFEKEIIYVWVGGSCDYGHKERAGGGAYIAQIFDNESKNSTDGKAIDTFSCSEFNTTEFKMIFSAMNHAVKKFAGQRIVFLSNVQYILNFEKQDLVDLRILPFHKFSQQQQVHELASQAMRELRKKQ
ncbi:hypothetical protein [Fibrobacter sp. UWEL]|uniref:hypothetical protein n=1 Tax=Fibrobacter sp. UWEL TaxID=1896209 RepID=UPI00091C6AE0|nr:hypothetical protein [Fibrobacter sp. UWEL]SHL05157.1 hypothetical protein SAMN05720468_11246 [Fibrobacter sp. UWEL]